MLMAAGVIRLKTNTGCIDVMYLKADDSLSCDGGVYYITSFPHGCTLMSCVPEGPELIASHNAVCVPVVRFQT